jgi:Ca2+-binding RTX toxin-like protein
LATISEPTVEETKAPTDKGDLTMATFTFTNPTAVGPFDATGVIGNSTPAIGSLVVDTTALIGQTVSSLEFTILGLNNNFLSDLDVLLRGPDDRNLMVMSDNMGSANATDVNLTFSDAAADLLPTVQTALNGDVVFRPRVETDGETLASFGLPDGPVAAALADGVSTLGSVFGGADLDGLWQVFVSDGSVLDPTSFAGFSMTVETAATTGTLLGTSGNDRIEIVNSAPDSGFYLIAGEQPVAFLGIVAWTILGLEGDDELTGSTGGDRLEGGGGVDTIFGSLGNDIIVGGFLLDEVFGGAGDDTFLLEGIDFGDNTYGGAGIDTIDLSAATDASVPRTYRLDLAAETFQLFRPGFGPGPLNDLLEVENAVGASNGDTLIGSDGANSLNGFDGDDTLIGGAGGDIVDGGNGDDLILLTGTDIVLGEEVIRGGAGVDTIRVTATDSFQIVVLSAGVVEGIERIETATDGADDASGLRTIILNAAQFGGDGIALDATFDANTNSRAITTISINMGDETTLDLGGIAFGPGWDTGDSVQVFGDADAENITGTARNDQIIGLGGNDTLRGLTGDDSLLGGDGNDLLDGGAGDDRMNGGLGNDRYVVAALGDTITGEIGFSQGGGIDTVLSFRDFALAPNLEVLRLQGSANLNGSGTAAPESFVGNPGTNRLDGGGGNDVINAKAGNDILIGGTGQDTLVGDIGADRFVFTSLADSYAGAATRDFLNGFSNGFDRIDLSAIDANPFNAGDQAFRFIGNAAFTGAGSNSGGELRFFTFGGGDFNIVEADWNGDGVAEMQVFVNGTNFMTEGDFIL